jgi:hypothetical protein
MFPVFVCTCLPQGVCLRTDCAPSLIAGWLEAASNIGGKAPTNKVIRRQIARPSPLGLGYCGSSHHNPKAKPTWCSFGFMSPDESWMCCMEQRPKTLSARAPEGPPEGVRLWASSPEPKPTFCGDGSQPLGRPAQVLRKSRRRSRCDEYGFRYGQDSSNLV